LARRGAVAYQLELPQSLSTIHNVFHISQLRKCLRVPIEATNYEDINIQPNLSYKEHPIRILDQAERKTRNKTTKFVKVQWSRHSEREATWEQEDQFRQSYPELFEIEYVHSQSHIYLVQHLLIDAKLIVTKSEKFLLLDALCLEKTHF